MSAPEFPALPEKYRYLLIDVRLTPPPPDEWKTVRVDLDPEESLARRENQRRLRWQIALRVPIGSALGLTLALLFITGASVAAEHLSPWRHEPLPDWMVLPALGLTIGCMVIACGLAVLPPVLWCCAAEAEHQEAEDRLREAHRAQAQALARA